MSTTITPSGVSLKIFKGSNQSFAIPVFYIPANYSALADDTYIDLKDIAFEMSTFVTRQNIGGGQELGANTAWNNTGHYLEIYGKAPYYLYARAPLTQTSFQFNAGSTSGPPMGVITWSGALREYQYTVCGIGIFVYNDVAMLSNIYLFNYTHYTTDVVSQPAYGYTCGYFQHPVMSNNPYDYKVGIWSHSSQYLQTYIDLAAAMLGSLKDDPYEGIPVSRPGMGMGNPEIIYETDDIDFPGLPTLSAINTGFISLWSPTEEQMLNLSAYLWNVDIGTISFWKKLMADPLDLIYGLNIIPLDLDAAGVVGANPDNVVVGLINTGLKMNYLTSQWVELDCGSIDIEEAWGAYIDYDPFTKLEIYLPYIGYRPLKVDDFMPGKISLLYRIDLLTGSCIAVIKSTKTKAAEHDTIDSVVYQFMGNCATQVPVTASQFADAVRSAIQLGAAIGSIVALGGAGAGAVASGAASSIVPAGGGAAAGTALMAAPPTALMAMDPNNFNNMIGQNLSGNDNWMPAPSRPSLADVGRMHASASAAENVMGIKPSIERSGAIGVAGGLLGVQTPYLIFTRPRQARPENQNKYTGYPSFVTSKLVSLTGFTQVQVIHLEDIPCTAGELAEIDQLLRSGVIF